MKKQTQSSFFVINIAAVFIYEETVSSDQDNFRLMTYFFQSLCWCRLVGDQCINVIPVCKLEASWFLLSAVNKFLIKILSVINGSDNILYHNLVYSNIKNIERQEKHQQKPIKSNLFTNEV